MKQYNQLLFHYKLNQKMEKLTTMTMKLDIFMRIGKMNGQILEISQKITEKQSEVDSIKFTLTYICNEDSYNYFRSVNNIVMVTFIQTEVLKNSSKLEMLKYEIAELVERKEQLTLESGIAVDQYNIIE